MIVMKECEYRDLKRKAEKIEKIERQLISRESLNSAVSRIMIGGALIITVITNVL